MASTEIAPSAPGSAQKTPIKKKKAATLANSTPKAGEAAPQSHTSKDTPSTSGSVKKKVASSSTDKPSSNAAQSPTPGSVPARKKKLLPHGDLNLSNPGEDAQHELQKPLQQKEQRAQDQKRTDQQQDKPQPSTVANELPKTITKKKKKVASAADEPPITPLSETGGQNTGVKQDQQLGGASNNDVGEEAADNGEVGKSQEDHAIDHEGRQGDTLFSTDQATIDNDAEGEDEEEDEEEEGEDEVDEEASNGNGEVDEDDQDGQDANNDEEEAEGDGDGRSNANPSKAHQDAHADSAKFSASDTSKPTQERGQLAEPKASENSKDFKSIDKSLREAIANKGRHIRQASEASDLTSKGGAQQKMHDAAESYSASAGEQFDISPSSPDGLNKTKDYTGKKLGKFLSIDQRGQNESVGANSSDKKVSANSQRFADMDEQMPHDLHVQVQSSRDSITVTIKIPTGDAFP